MYAVQDDDLGKQFNGFANFHVLYGCQCSLLVYFVHNNYNVEVSVTLILVVCGLSVLT